MGAREDPGLDRDLADLPSDLRWREWMRRIEAVLFASAAPVARDDLAKVVGQGVSVDLLIEDLRIDLEGRSFEIARVAGSWMLRTRPAYAPAIRAAADPGGQALNLSEFDMAVLAAIAFHQPISRDGLKEIFGTEVSRDLIGRLAGQNLIATGPRKPRRSWKTGDRRRSPRPAARYVPSGLGRSASQPKPEVLRRSPPQGWQAPQIHHCRGRQKADHHRKRTVQEPPETSRPGNLTDTVASTIIILRSRMGLRFQSGPCGSVVLNLPQKVLGAGVLGGVEEGVG